jgi:hypothetical protein
MSAYEVQRFLLDPLKYVRTVCINLQTASGQIGSAAFNANKAYAPCYFDLVPWSSSLFGGASQVALAPTATMGQNQITGYYVPYISYQSVASTASDHIDPVLLDNVPKTLPANRFIFTGGQNGCSLLLLTGGAPGTVSALHYPNSDGKAKGYPLLAKVGKTAADIIIAIDFGVYGSGNPDDARHGTYHPNAASFFYHDGKEWIGVTQPQVQGPVNMEWKRPSMSINKDHPPRFVKANGSGILT